ncbi:MAG: ribosome maturation factor RimM [Acidiferrobacterales bacterium]
MADQAPPDTADKGLVIMGRISGLFGVRGWLKVKSHTRQRADILDYRCWLLRLKEGWKEFSLTEGRIHGPGLVVQLEGIADRDAAATLVGADIAVHESRLPAPDSGQYYWAQLEGLEVVNSQGVGLGTVRNLFETGANDVMVVVGERERLVPFVRGVVRRVDLAAGTVLVDWDADF